MHIYALVRIAITGAGWMDGWMNTDGSYLYSRYSQTQPLHGSINVEHTAKGPLQKGVTAADHQGSCDRV